MIRAMEAGWPVTAEHDSEGEIESVRYCMFTRDMCGATFHHQEREHGGGVELDNFQVGRMPEQQIQIVLPSTFFESSRLKSVLILL